LHSIPVPSKSNIRFSTASTEAGQKKNIRPSLGADTLPLLETTPYLFSFSGNIGRIEAKQNTSIEQETWKIPTARSGTPVAHYDKLSANFNQRSPILRQQLNHTESIL